MAKFRRKSQLDVAILGLNFPPEPTGIAPYAGFLANELADAGYTVAAHVAHPHYPEWRIYDGYGQWSAQEITDHVSVRRRLHYVPKSPRGVRRLLSELSYGLRLVAGRWDGAAAYIAVTPALFATALVTLRIRLTPSRPPLVVWVQDIYTLGMLETRQGAGVGAKVTRWVEMRTLRAADRVVVIHPRFADYVVAEFGLNPMRVCVIRNWAHLPETQVLDSQAAKSILGWPADATLVVHTGNMGVKQGLDNVVEAARLADELELPIHFVLVGDGAERSAIEAQSRGLKRLSIVDPLSEQLYLVALGAADILIVNEKPGVAAMAVPSKLTSYFHAARPVVAATDLDGITASEIRSSGAGVVVRAGDPRLLLEVIAELAADRVRMAELGRKGRRYRETVLDQRSAITNWIETVDSILPTAHVSE